MILGSSVTKVEAGDAATNLKEADGNPQTDAEAKVTVTTNVPASTT